ncbi:MAG: site-specific integrase, partial [bacterium]
MEKRIALFMDYLVGEIGASQHTIKAYYRDLQQYRSFLEATGRADVISPNSTRDFGAHLLKKGEARSSVERKLSALRSFCKFLCRDGELDVGIPMRILLPKKEKKL